MPDTTQPDRMTTPTPAVGPTDRRGLACHRALRLVVGAAILAAATLGTRPTLAQMPGMDVETRKEQTVGDSAETATRLTAARLDEEAAGLLRYWQRYMGEDSPYRGLILVILTLVILLNLKAYLTRTMRRTLEAKAFTQENTAAFLKIWNSLWKVATAILVIMAMSGSLRLLGLTAGFFGMMLGWSLQQPVTGIAAWLMIVLKKPFKIGDRVIIAGITGDVTGISLTHVILNQVGGSIGGEEKSGRGILIPNAIRYRADVGAGPLAAEKTDAP